MARDLVFCLSLGYSEREYWRMTQKKINGLYRAYVALHTEAEPKQSIRDIMPSEE